MTSPDRSRSLEISKNRRKNKDPALARPLLKQRPPAPACAAIEDQVEADCGALNDKRKKSADTVRLAMAHCPVHVDVVAGRNRCNRQCQSAEYREDSRGRQERPDQVRLGPYYRRRARPLRLADREARRKQ